MADFPTISPDSIAFELGGMNVSEAAAKTVGGVYFRHSLKTDNVTCTVTFQNILSSAVEEIRNHYFARGGSSLPFGVNHSSFWGAINAVPTDSTYRYNSPPEEEHFGVYNNVTVSFLVTLGSTFGPAPSTPGAPPSGIANFYLLVGEPAQLGSLASFTSYAFSGTAPFILDADDADPSVATSLILNAGGAAS